MLLSRSVLRALIAVALLAAPPMRDADAQVIERPPRSRGGLLGGLRPADPNRSSTELTLSLAFMGGWDDNLLPEGTEISTDPFAPSQSGYAGTATGALRYWRGRASRSFETSGRAFVNGYSNLGVHPLVGGDLRASGSALLGRSTQVSAGADALYQPTVVLGAFDPVAGQVDSGVVLNPDPTNGVTRMRSLTVNSTAGLSQRWSARQQTTLGYGFSRHSFLGPTSIDSRNQDTSISHNWEFARAVGLRPSYRYSDQRIEQAVGRELPVRTHRADLEMHFRRRISRTRQLTFSIGGGALHIRSIDAPTSEPFEHVAPSGFGSVRLDVGRTWALSADYRRDENVLEGVTHLAFISDAASLTLGGNIGGRLASTISAAYSSGSSPGTATGSYEAFAGTAQMQVLLARCCSLVTVYSYYAHRLRDLAAVPAGLPSRFERSSIRAGMSVLLPLYGTF